MPTNYDIEYPKLQQKCQRLQARVEVLECVLDAARVVSGNACTLNWIKLRKAILAATEQEKNDE